MAEPDGTDESLPATGVAVGIALGAGLTALAVVLLDESLAVLGYGAGGGLVVGALTGRLAEANVGQDDWSIRVAGGGAVLGLIFGSGLGVLVAWVRETALTAGVAVGAPAGLVHGLLVGVVLVANERAK